MNQRQWFTLFILSLLWGSSFLFIGLAVKALPTLTIVTIRMLIAAIVLLFVVKTKNLELPTSLKSWQQLMVMGFLNCVLPFSLIVWGQAIITSGLASILNATTPLFAVVLAHLLTSDERASMNKLVGVIFGFLGILVIFGPNLLQLNNNAEINTNTYNTSKNIMAQVAILLAAISYSLAGIFGKRFRVAGMNPIVTATGQVVCSAILILPFACWLEQPWQYLHAFAMPEVSLSLAGLGVLSTALAYVLYFNLLATAGATNVLLVTFLIPVSAILLGIAILDESLTLYQLAGMFLIGIGLLVIDARLLRNQVTK